MRNKSRRDDVKCGTCRGLNCVKNEILHQLYLVFGSFSDGIVGDAKNSDLTKSFWKKRKQNLWERH